MRKYLALVFDVILSYRNNGFVMTSFLSIHISCTSNYILKTNMHLNYTEYSHDSFEFYSILITITIYHFLSIYY